MGLCGGDKKTQNLPLKLEMYNLLLLSGHCFIYATRNNFGDPPFGDPPFFFSLEIHLLRGGDPEQNEWNEAQEKCAIGQDSIG